MEHDRTRRFAVRRPIWHVCINSYGCAGHGHCIAMRKDVNVRPIYKHYKTNTSVHALQSSLTRRSAPNCSKVQSIHSFLLTLSAIHIVFISLILTFTMANEDGGSIYVDKLLHHNVDITTHIGNELSVAFINTAPLYIININLVLSCSIGVRPA